MRLLMTADSVGGVWQYALYLAQGLRKFDVVTTLATLGPSASTEQRTRAAAIPDLQLIETGLPLDWLADNEALIAEAALHIANIARLKAVDLVQLNSPIFAAFGYFQRPVIGVCHSCVATWWDATCPGDLPTDFLWRTALVTQGYSACDRLVAPSRAFAAMTARRYGVLPNVVPNGAGMPSFKRGLAKERFVLTAGRLWDKGKNFSTLDEAAASLDAPVYAAGNLSQFAAGETPCHHAVPLGNLDFIELQAWMHRAAIYASMALYEPFGLAVLEAAQAGCALVLSDTDGFREIWGDAAIFVDPYDRVALSAALQMLLNNGHLMQKMGDAARTRAETYSIDTMASGMMDIYRGLVTCGSVAA